VLLSVLLVPRIGIVGSALGTLIPQLIMTLFVGPWYVRRELGIPLRTFWLNTHVRPLVAVLPFASVSFFFEHWWPSPNLLVYFGQIALTLPFAALGAWLFGLSLEERNVVAALFARRSGRALAKGPIAS